MTAQMDLRMFVKVLNRVVLLLVIVPSVNMLGATNAPISVTDFRGVTLRFDKPVSRIVCLIESGLSGLYMLGAADRIVGVPACVYRDSVADQYAALDKRIKDHLLLSPGNWDFVNVETVVGLRPDVVIMWAAQKESVAALEDKGIAVYGVELGRFDDIYREMRDFGDLTGTRSRADALIDFTQKEIAGVSKRVGVSGIPKPRTYFMWAQGPLETSGRKSTVNELLEMAGSANACPLPDEHIVVNLEKVMVWNPEVIIMWFNARRNPADIAQLDGWRLTSAVKKGRVYEMPAVFLCDFWTLKFQYAVKVAAKWCRPDAFADIDLEKELQRMMEILYGKRGLDVLK